MASRSGSAIFWRHPARIDAGAWLAFSTASGPSRLLSSEKGVPDLYQICTRAEEPDLYRICIIIKRRRSTPEGTMMEGTMMMRAHEAHPPVVLSVAQLRTVRGSAEDPADLDLPTPGCAAARSQRSAALNV
eukprot:scaffold98808_cov69-Phaeocystis_antarctica.AAC.4